MSGTTYIRLASELNAKTQDFFYHVVPLKSAGLRYMQVTILSLNHNESC